MVLLAEVEPSLVYLVRSDNERRERRIPAEESTQLEKAVTEDTYYCA